MLLPFVENTHKNTLNGFPLWFRTSSPVKQLKIIFFPNLRHLFSTWRYSVGDFRFLMFHEKSEHILFLLSRNYGNIWITYFFSTYLCTYKLAVLSNYLSDRRAIQKPNNIQDLNPLLILLFQSCYWCCRGWWISLVKTNNGGSSLQSTIPSPSNPFSPPPSSLSHPSPLLFFPTLHSSISSRH